MCHALQRLHPALSVSLRVQHYPLYEGPLFVQSYINEILQGIDSFALLTYKQGSVIRSHVHSDKPSGIVHVQSCLKIHSRKERRHHNPYLVNKLPRGIGHVSGYRLLAKF